MSIDAARVFFIQPRCSTTDRDLARATLKGADVDPAALYSTFVGGVSALLGENLQVWEMAPERGERALAALAKRYEAKLKERGLRVVWYSGFAVD